MTTPTDDEMKKAEQRGYARGYQAGKKRIRSARQAEHDHRERQAFLDKAFLATLPFALQQTTWKRGEKPIGTIPDRVDLAWEIAESALKRRKLA